MNDDLKPCPFCGGKVTLMTLITGINMFYCKNYKYCGAVVSFDNPVCNREKGDSGKIKAWNRRTES